VRAVGEDRVNYRNGYRDRRWDNWASTIKLAIPRLLVRPMTPSPSCRTAHEYSNVIVRERLRPTATGLRPAPATASDLVAESSHRWGQGFKSPQLHPNLQVADSSPVPATTT